MMHHAFMNGYAALIIGFFGCARSASAQLNSSGLSLRYGVPLDRETFRLPAGFDLVVDYGASKQVCRLEVPALIPPGDARQPNGRDLKQQMYDFLLDLVPPSMRGKQLRSMMYSMGALAIAHTEFQFVSINESMNAGNSGAETIVISFSRSECAGLKEPEADLLDRDRRRA